MQRPSSRIPAILLATALALGASACSGGDDSGISKEEFLEKAAAICEDGRARIEEEGQQLDDSDPGAMGDYVQFVSAEVLDEIDQIRDLGFPEDGARTLDEAFRVYESRFSTWQEDPSQIGQAAGDKQLEAAGKALQEYGLDACGANVGN